MAQKKIPNESMSMAMYSGEPGESESMKMHKKEGAMGESDEENGDGKDPFEEFAPVLEQIQSEFNFAYQYIKVKWSAWLVRLRLYNNQKRKRDAIGDPLLFTIFQTVLASLYSDKLTVEFVGREHGDDEQAENLNLMAQYDTEEMMKEQIDYDWIWDTCFFGRGLLLMQEWCDESISPIPEVIDPLTFLRDPDAISANGDKRGRGGLRFFGRQIRMTKCEMEEAGVYQNLDKLCGETTSSTNQTEIDRNVQARREAQGYDQLRQGLKGSNTSYVLYEWWTYFNDKKYFFTTNATRSVLFRAQEVKTKRWPLVDRTLFKTAHDWDGVSIPDLVEDKQRGRALIMNLAKKGVQAKLYPNYLYNNLMIKNKADLAKIDFNKFVGVAGNPNGVVAEIPRANITTDVQWMLDLMDGNAQKATATPDIQQGALSEKVKSATEIAKVTQGVDTRYSLAAKLFAWSEKAFWKLYYEMNFLYFTSKAYNKTIRIIGALGPQYHKIQRENIITDADPDIFIESKALSDAKRMNKMNMLGVFINQAVAMDPGTNRRFLLKEQGKAMGMTSDDLNRALPKTLDELEAEEENLLLEKNKLPKISVSQNHFVHIEIHSKAADTKAKMHHIDLHKLALLYQRKMAMAQASQAQPEGQNGQAPATPGQPNINGEPSPMEKGTAPAPRDMAQSQLQLQAPNAVQIATK